MYYRLILKNHVDGVKSTRWTFSPPAVVGREPNAQVCIDHDSISRKHCQFSLNGEGALVVKDLDSMNGTYVDDSRIQHATLMPGQIVQIGALRLEVDFSGEAEEINTASRPKGSVYATQPMATFRPVPLPPERPWWRRIFG